MVSDSEFYFLAVALAIWGVMALRYPAPVAFLVGYAALFLYGAVPPRLFMQPPISPLWVLGTISTAALLARLLVPQLIALRDAAPGLARFAPVLTGSAAAFEFDSETGSGRPTSLATSIANTISGLSPLGIPLIAAAFLMQVSVGRVMVAAILPALALAVVGAFLSGRPGDAASGSGVSDRGTEFLAPAVASLVLLLILFGVATPTEAFMVSTLVLLVILLRLNGLRETATLFNNAVPDVARVVLLILAAAPVYAVFNMAVRPGWMIPLLLDFPIVFFGLSLCVAAAFGFVGGSLAAIVAMILLFAAPVSDSYLVQPVQIMLAWIFAAEAGCFVAARWRAGLEGAGAIWVFVLLASAGLALATDVWVLPDPFLGSW